MGDLSEHFSREEFACPCGCGFGLKHGDVAFKLIDLLEELRTCAGDRPIYICKRPGGLVYAAGCRCADRNRAAGGVSDSQHRFGRAADIVIPGLTPDEVAALAEPLLANGGLGRYDTFTHVDVRGGRARWDRRSR